MFQSVILQHIFRRKTNRKSYGKFLKRGVCMLHVKDSEFENKVPVKWHLNFEVEARQPILPCTTSSYHKVQIATTSDKVSPKKKSSFHVARKGK